MKKYALLLLSVVFLCVDAFGVVPERRRNFEDRNPNVYLILPAVASLPGVGVFVGILASGSNLGDTGIDTAITRAESVDGSDISINAYAIREVPLGIPGLKFEYWFGDIRFERFSTFIPGRNSPNFQVPFTGEIKFQLLRPVWRVWGRRIQLSYTQSFSDGFRVNSEGREVKESSYGANGQVLLDFTDDEIDPSKGVRFRYQTTLEPPSSSIFGKETTEREDDFLKAEQFELIFYIPWMERNTLVHYTQFLQASEPVRNGQPGAGSINLRGYPEGRWTEQYGFATALENRYLIPLNTDVSIGIARGTLEGIQLAAFYEVGQISDANDGKLYSELRQSIGGGIRLLLEAIVVRFDIATSNDERQTQTYLTIDQPF